MNEFSENTRFKLNSLEEQITGSGIDIESFLNIISSVFKERENVLKSADKSVIQNFKKIMMSSGKTEATASTMISRLSNGKRPFTREYAVMFCYAAGYKTEEADNQLRKIFLVDGFHLRNYEDMIDSFYLRENTLDSCINNFVVANEMKAKFKTKYDNAEVSASVESSAADNFREYTEFFEVQSENINSAEELDNFLRSDYSLQRAGNINRTAKAYLYDVLIELCTKVIDRIDIVQSNDELEQLYSELDGKKLSESIIKLVQDIFDPYSYYFLRPIDICTRPEYHERYKSNVDHRLLPKKVLDKECEYKLHQNARELLCVWNSNYNDIAISFENALQNKEFDNLIKYIAKENNCSRSTVIEQIKCTYFHSMFNLMIYDSEWGLGDYLGLPRIRTEYEMTVNENAVEGNSTFRGINQMDEQYFFYSPELPGFVIDYMSAVKGDKFLNLYNDEGVHVKPFILEVNTVQNLLFIAISMLNKDSDDDTENSDNYIADDIDTYINDYIDEVMRETGEIPVDHSPFSQNLSALVKEMGNTKSTAANTMLISGAPTVNRTLLAFCLVLRELLDTFSNDPQTILNNVNQSLNHCKMAQLNPHNPLDLLLLGSIYTKSPLSYIKAYLLYMLPNI